MKIFHEKKHTHKKKKPYSSITFTTGDPQKNIDHFNRMLSGLEKNTHLDGLANSFVVDSFKGEESTTESSAAQSSSSSEAEGVGMSENFKTESEVLLQEAKRRVRRYYAKPQNEFFSTKNEILNFLIDHEDEDCTIYSLVNLDRDRDITKLTSKDIIYVYEDNILYDKNKVKIMDYTLYVKHEEERPKIDVEHAPERVFDAAYEDRLTGKMTESAINEFELNFEDINAFHEVLVEGKVKDGICCICGEQIDGFGNNPEPYMSIENGMCCDSCNLHFVIPARLAQWQNHSDDNEEKEQEQNDNK